MNLKKLSFSLLVSLTCFGLSTSLVSAHCGKPPSFSPSSGDGTITSPYTFTLQNCKKAHQLDVDTRPNPGDPSKPFLEAVSCQINLFNLNDSLQQGKRLYIKFQLPDSFTESYESMSIESSLFTSQYGKMFGKYSNSEEFPKDLDNAVVGSNQCTFPGVSPKTNVPLDGCIIINGDAGNPDNLNAGNYYFEFVADKKFPDKGVDLGVGFTFKDALSFTLANSYSKACKTESNFTPK